MLVLLLAVTGAGASSHGGSGVVAKEHFSDTLRFVFVAGLEGAGHHAWQTLLTPCRTSSTFCFELRSFTRDVWLFQDGVSDRSLFALGRTNLTHRRAFIARYMEAIARRLGEGERGFAECRPRMVLVNVNHAAGMMSYPNGGFFDDWFGSRVLHHPDLTELARAAELARVDLRVVVSVREPGALLASTTVHRTFGASVASQGAVLADSALILAGQLAGIDRRFWSCVDLFADARGLGAQHLREWSLWRFMHPRWPAGELELLAASVASLGAALAGRHALAAAQAHNRSLGRRIRGSQPLMYATDPRSSDYAAALLKLDRASRVLEHACAREPRGAVAPPLARTERTMDRWAANRDREPPDDAKVLAKAKAVRAAFASKLEHEVAHRERARAARAAPSTASELR
ncbi:hypothetical protein T492DRAFT_1020801 [Pavlovales sp. CCMP2436]|nr:hypothetical protein T492DRAFT_1020801 [Pavlovales sp. CCMP2436]